MKTINKKAAPVCLGRAVTNRWNWEQFTQNDRCGYIDCREQANQEQSSECAYTGLWIGENSKYDVHLDHYRKKGMCSNLTFEWCNLFAAVKNSDYGSDFKDRIVDDDSAYTAIWSPLQKNLASSFWYREDGVMEPAEGLLPQDAEKAQRTIDTFNLNDSSLKDKRRAVILDVQNMKTLPPDCIRECMAGRGFSFVVEFELALIDHANEIQASSRMSP